MEKDNNEKEIEIIYLDDQNIKHIGYVKNTEELDFVKNRFTLLDSYLECSN